MSSWRAPPAVHKNSNPVHRKSNRAVRRIGKTKHLFLVTTRRRRPSPGATCGQVRSGTCGKEGVGCRVRLDLRVCTPGGHTSAVLAASRTCRRPVGASVSSWLTSLPRNIPGSAKDRPLPERRLLAPRVGRGFDRRSRRPANTSASLPRDLRRATQPDASTTRVKEHPTFELDPHPPAI